VATHSLISVLPRSIGAALAGAALYVIWIPRNSMIYDFVPTGQDEPVATAAHVQSRGYFGYVKSTTTYYQIGSGVPAKQTSGVSGRGLTLSILATLLVSMVLLATTEPGFARTSLRHLTMRWSGP